MANYYTTRFNANQWPPSSFLVPPGVELDRQGLSDAGHPCCSNASLLSARSQAREERWFYRTVYRLACRRHGETEITLDTQLDWISPNEYLLTRSETAASGPSEA